MLTQKASRLLSSFQKFGKSWYETFQKSGAGGKVILMIGTAVTVFIMMCCLCTIPLVAISINSTPDPGESALSADTTDQDDEQDPGQRSSEPIPIELAESPSDEPEPTLTSKPTDAPTVTKEPTKKPTSTKRPTNTPKPTSTQKPTSTPRPTSTPTTAPTSTRVLPTSTPRPPTNTPIPPTPTPSNEQTTLVTYVVDGDTIIVDLVGVEERVRYIGIDAPEIGKTCGDEATRANAALVSGQTVTLVKDISERDRYDRLLRYVYVGDTFVNAELIKDGWAVAYRYEPDTSQADYLESLQDSAPTRSCEIIPTNPPPPTDIPPTQQPPPPAPPADSPPPEEPPPQANCSPYYPTVCIPPKSQVGDLDCGEISYRRFQVLQPDPHGFDGDKDGVGCESG